MPVGCLALALLTIALVTGCQSSRDDSPPAAATAQATASSQALARNPDKAEAGGRERVLYESWEAIFLEGDKVGHGHLVWTELDESLMQITSDSRLRLQRFGQSVSTEMSATSVETPAGQLVRCRSALSQAAGPIETKGRVEGQQLMLETSTAGKTQRQSIPWDPAWGGFFVDQVSLKRRPMTPGERRTLRGLVPMFNQVGEYHLQAVRYEPVELLSAQQRLLRIEGQIRLVGATIDTVVWTNEQGEVLKTSTSFSGLEQVSFRTSKKLALSPSAAPKFDLGRQTIVKTDRQLDQPHRTAQVVYVVRMTAKDPAEVFVDDPAQKLERIDDRSVRLTVKSVRPEDPLTDAPHQRPTPADLEPNNLIQSDHPLIVEMAERAAAPSANHWELARRLERFVSEAVQSKNFTQAMASAADVAQNLEGDCTEHSVLLAALCRAHQIPARVAIGLIYYPQAQGFAYHMWNEVWIQDRWLALDGTLGMGGIGAGHIKVTTSNLQGASPYTALLPVLNILGQELQIAITDVKHAG